MQIREPKFKFGDKVYCKQYKSSAIITGVSDYSFNTDKYFYNVEWEHDDYLDEIHEDLLEPYIEKPKSVWDLKEGDTYYSIYGNGNVSSEKKWFDDEYENNYREIGNVFLTREEAEFEVERRKIETEMIKLGGRRKFELGKANWYLEYRPMSEGIEAMWTTYEMRQGTIYYDSEEKAKKVVEIIGKGIIKKYLFGVEE
jgi:hypothetical protein